MTIENKNHVSWAVFILILGIVSGIISYLAVGQDKLREDVGQIKIDVKGTQKDISWLIKAIEKGDVTINKVDVLTKINE